MNTEYEKISNESTPQNFNLLKAKKERNDVEKYNAEFLFRQRVINEKVIDWSGSVHPGTAVLDACAGPEGSFLAVSRRDGKWFGNEVSLKTASYLKNTGGDVVIGSADRFAFKEGAIDLVLFIFALNNIGNTREALSEAYRVLGPEGRALISDPGETRWATDLYMYFALKNGSLPPDLAAILKKSTRFGQHIGAYYQKYPEREEEEKHRIELYLKGLYNLSFQEIPSIIKQIYTDAKEKAKDIRASALSGYFHEELESKYWLLIVEAALSNGFKIEKLGIFSAYQTLKTPEDKEWQVGGVHGIPIPSNNNEIPKLILDIRNNNHELSRDIIHPGKSMVKNVVSPVLLIKK
ncbi:MAG: methyltransferase domain-containing protein [Patescibacteria group bacterium]|nr:methyltransferase domain-containing protein [Patescibacteria group bacterium]